MPQGLCTCPFFLLSGTLFLNIYMAYTFTSFKNLFKCLFVVVVVFYKVKVYLFFMCQLEFQVIGPLDSTQSFVILFSSPTRDWIWALALWVLSPNHWTTREFPNALFFSSETFPNHLFKIAETFHPKFYPSIFSIALSIIYFILYLLFFLSFFPLHSDYQLYEGCDLSVYFFHFCVPRTCHRAQYIVVSQQ